MSEQTFEAIKAALEADPKLGGKVGGVLAFVLTGPDSEWVVDCKKSTVTKGSGKADCTITLSEDNFIALASGKLNGMQAFMSGKMKIKGSACPHRSPDEAGRSQPLCFERACCL